jgi:acyl-CoA synthetase (AMP-forming)/AMP-acid ligase II
MNAQALLEGPFATLSELITLHARDQPERTALIHGEQAISYAELDALMNRVAAALQRDHVGEGQAVAIIGGMSVPYVLAFLGALRAGCVPTPIAPSSTPEQIAAMVGDCAAPIVFGEDALASLDQSMMPPGATPAPVEIAPEDPFNIIYSSGTTGTPKGIVQSHAMRWAHIAAARAVGFADAVTMIATPLYSNTTLVSFLPTLAYGGTAVLLGKFDAVAYLDTAERHRATHTMLVPVQYARLMAVPDFDARDLSSFRFKTCTSAPFPPALKADVVARWPGMLVEYYGLTEGGGTCVLICNAFPQKLHTVGRPAEGSDIRLIDDDGNEAPRGQMGEVVGRSRAMMSGYHRRDEATSDATWFDAEGNRYIRQGDIGRFDEDGFLTLLDRKKDVIISGGFNVYPSDIEVVLAEHPDVADCTVVGVPSDAWGETPVGFYVPHGAPEDSAAAILGWVNARVGKTQRLTDLRALDALPRNAIGKVLKRELRDLYTGASA